MAVLFNGLTTITGFGSLLVADHRGVWSLGLLLVIGSVMTLAASLIVLPTLMRLMSAAPARAGRGVVPSGARQPVEVLHPAAATSFERGVPTMTTEESGD